MNDIQKACKTFLKEESMYRYGYGRVAGRKKGCPAWNKGHKKGDDNVAFKYIASKKNRT